MAQYTNRQWQDEVERQSSGEETEEEEDQKQKDDKEIRRTDRVMTHVAVKAQLGGIRRRRGCQEEEKRATIPNGAQLVDPHERKRLTLDVIGACQLCAMPTGHSEGCEQCSLERFAAFRMSEKHLRHIVPTLHERQFGLKLSFLF